MPIPTKAELQSKFDALQIDYKNKLDDIFDKLYKRLGDIEVQTPEAPAMASMPSAAASMPPMAQPTPIAADIPKEPVGDDVSSPTASTSTSKSTPSFIPPMPTVQKGRKVPRWRDTWTYQGLKGLASRAWRGTNPEDAAWKYANENEGLLPRLTLQEYLDLRESANYFVDCYFIIEEAVQPEISLAFTDARDEVIKLVVDFLKKAHNIGMQIGDLIATTRYMFPPKQQNLFDKGRPEKKELPPDITEPSILQTKAAETPLFPEVPAAVVEKPTKSEKSSKKPRKRSFEAYTFTADQIKNQNEILEVKVGNDSVYKKIKPFEPWTWFKWPKANKNITDAELVDQWDKMAGAKFSDNLSGLTNLFSAIRNRRLGNELADNYHNDSAIRSKIASLLGIKDVKGRPWTDFVKLGKFESELDADEFLAKQIKPMQSNAVEPEVEAPQSTPQTSSMDDLFAQMKSNKAAMSSWGRSY